MPDKDHLALSRDFRTPQESPWLDPTRPLQPSSGGGGWGSLRLSQSGPVLHVSLPSDLGLLTLTFLKRWSIGLPQFRVLRTHSPERQREREQECIRVSWTWALCGHVLLANEGRGLLSSSWVEAACVLLPPPEPFLGSLEVPRLQGEDSTGANPSRDGGLLPAWAGKTRGTSACCLRKSSPEPAAPKACLGWSAGETPGLPRQPWGAARGRDPQRVLGLGGETAAQLLLCCVCFCGVF